MRTSQSSVLAGSLQASMCRLRCSSSSESSNHRPQTLHTDFAKNLVVPLTSKKCRDYTNKNPDCGDNVVRTLRRDLVKVVYEREHAREPSLLSFLGTMKKPASDFMNWSHLIGFAGPVTEKIDVVEIPL